MTATPTEHRAKIAEARNVLGEVISRARYANEPTILINRGKEAAVIVSHPFYEEALRNQALVAQLTEMAGLPAGVSAEERPDLVHTARILHEALAKAERGVRNAESDD